MQARGQEFVARQNVLQPGVSLQAPEHRVDRLCRAREPRLCDFGPGDGGNRLRVLCHWGAEPVGAAPEVRAGTLSNSQIALWWPAASCGCWAMGQGKPAQGVQLNLIGSGPAVLVTRLAAGSE